MSEIYQEIERASAELFILNKHNLEGIVKLRNSYETFFAMQWVCLTVRPLSLTELRYALASNSIVKANDQSLYNSGACLVKSDQANTVNEQFVRRSGGCLVEVKNLRSGGNVALFVHQTVSDFLISGGLDSLAMSSTSTHINPKANVIGRSHNQLSRARIQYLG
jgi:hypothetical protein